MYVPPYEYILRKLGVEKGQLGDEDDIKIPLKLLKFLLQVALSTGAFEEEDYLKSYPDVAEAVEKSHFVSGHSHFLTVGFFEDRKSSAYDVDEAWYLDKHTEVRDAIAAGDFASADDHFKWRGAHEGLSPSEEAQYDLHFWEEMLRRV